jgi:hypothetical protein
LKGLFYFSTCLLIACSGLTQALQRPALAPAPFWVLDTRASGSYEHNDFIQKKGYGYGLGFGVRASRQGFFSYELLLLYEHSPLAQKLLGQVCDFKSTGIELTSYSQVPDSSFNIALGVNVYYESARIYEAKAQTSTKYKDIKARLLGSKLIFGVGFILPQAQQQKTVKNLSKIYTYEIFFQARLPLRDKQKLSYTQTTADEPSRAISKNDRRSGVQVSLGIKTLFY